MSDSLPTPNMLIADGALVCLGEQQITSLASAVSLVVPDGAYSMIVCPEGKDVRFSMTGTPTATTGMPIAVGEKFPFTGDLSKFKFIEQSASAKLNVVYFH
jgi:hypothetical protein